MPVCIACKALKHLVGQVIQWVFCFIIQCMFCFIIQCCSVPCLMCLGRQVMQVSVYWSDWGEYWMFAADSANEFIMKPVLSANLTTLSTPHCKLYSSHEGEHVGWQYYSHTHTHTQCPGIIFTFLLYVIRVHTVGKINS